MPINLSKNTVISGSIGTVVAAVAVIWGMSGIGRPLFAADMHDFVQAVEELVEASSKQYTQLDTKTSISFLEIQKGTLQTELRSLRRELRSDPSDLDLPDDIDEIEEDIEDINTIITCHRTIGCTV